MAEIQADGAEERRKKSCFTWPSVNYETFQQVGNVVLARVGRVGNDNAFLVQADFSTWPPRIQNLAHGYPTDVDVGSDGRIVIVISRPGTYYYVVKVLPGLFAPNLKARELTSEEIIGENGYDWAVFFRDKVVASTSFAWKETKKRWPLFQSGSNLVPNKMFDPPEDDHGEDCQQEWVRHGVAKTSDGSQVFVWRDTGYEWENGKLVETFQLAAGDGYGDFETIPCGEDGFYYLSKRKLFESHRGREPVSHLEELDNIMDLRAGPEGSLLLHEGHNKTGDFGKFYWPESGEIVRLRRNFHPDIGHDGFRTFRWLEEKKVLLAFTWKEVWRIPWEELKDLPRRKVRS